MVCKPWQYATIERHGCVRGAFDGARCSADGLRLRSMNETRTKQRGALSARVAEFVQSQPSSRRSGRARAAVIALREEIAQAIADGWAVKAIWQTLRADGSVTVGYEAFWRQVSELVRRQPSASPAPKVPVAEPRAPASPDARRFEHSAAPQKDEIY